MVKMRVFLYDPKVAPRLAYFADQIRDLRSFFRNYFIPQYLQDVRKNFDTEGKLVGGWEPLSPAYEEWKEQVRPGRPINQFSKRLYNAFSPKGRSKYLVVELTPKQARIGVNLPYALWVQEARPFMLRPKELANATYSRMFNKFVKDLADKTGFKPDATGRHKSTSVFGPSWFDSPATWTEEMRQKFKAEEKSFNRYGDMKTGVWDSDEDDDF